jgi:3-isopropylmalate/(R)-2-methylmalate dehydratase small subunit
VDLEAQRVFFGDQNFTIVIPDTAFEALTSGKWDPIAELLENKDAVHERMVAQGWVK